MLTIKQRSKLHHTCLLFVMMLLAAALPFKLFGQAPVITYSNPNNYTPGTPIATLTPGNSGGAVAAQAYANPVTYSSGFFTPGGVALDAVGNLYVADYGNNVVKKIPPGPGSPVIIGSGFFHPNGIAVDAAGNVYVADMGNNVIKEIPVGGGAVITLGGGFFQPTGVAVDAAGNVYVADHGNQAVEKIPAGGGIPSYVASSLPSPYGVAVDEGGNVYVANQNGGVTEYPAGGGAAISINTSINHPTGIAFSAGNLYVASSTDNEIFQLPATGGTPVAIGFGFNTPTGIAVDAADNIFIADFNNSVVKEIVPVGGYYVNPALPAGISLNSTTGVISGTPTAVLHTTNFTVTAYNASGSGSANVTLTSPLNFNAIPAKVYGTADFDPGATSSYSINYSSGTPGVATIVAGKIHTTGVGTSVITAVSNSVTHTQTLTVTAATLVITPFSKVRSVTQANPAFTFSYSGFVNGDSHTVLTAQPVGTTTANGSSPVGSYPVIATGATSPNYSISYQQGVLRIVSPAPGISYGGAQNYPAGTAITPLVPSNLGGSVPAGVYAQVSSFANDGGFYQPTGIATDFTGNVFVVDGNNLVKKITPAGTTTIFAGSVGYGLVNGVGTAAKFSLPKGIAVDGAGNIYIAEGSFNQFGPPGNNLIRKITPAGLVTTFAGSGASGAADATGTAASFNNPNGVATDASGNVYVADTYNNKIRKITPEGVVTTFAGSGAVGAVNSTGIAASFNSPQGIAIDALGNIYVADSGNNLIRMITPAAVVTTLAGSGTPGSADGTGTAATFNFPWGITTDAARNVYVGDASNNVIRRITPAGVVTTLAGSGASGVDNGVGTAATFRSPAGVVADYFGNLYVADELNSVTRKVLITGFTITPALPAGLSFDSATGTILGTPTAISPPTNYTVTAYNAAGSSTAIVSIQVSGAISSNDDLSGLTLSSGTLTPAFAPGTVGYTASVTNATSSITVTPTASESHATITVNGTAVVSGSASGAIPLNVGSNVITTVVTAQDGATNKHYTVTVTRAAVSNGLSALSVSSGTLSPAFAVGTTAYTVSESNATTSVTVTPATNAVNNVITVNGTTVTSGSASQSIPLAVGNNTITIVVSAQGSPIQTTTITITRVSTNDFLSNLTISSGTLTPTFATGTTGYTASVPSAITSITLTPTTADAGATVKINGTTVASGTASGAIALVVGPNTISTVVTAQDGTSTRTYTITLIRQSANSGLSGLAISSGTLSPVFATGTTGYSDAVGSAVSSITVTPTASNNHATIKVNGTTVASGTASASIPLSVGANTISVVVTSQDATTTTTYTVTVTRAASVLNDATLSALGVSAGSLSPAFASATTGYFNEVPNTTTSIKLTPTATNPNATIKVNGVTVASGASSANLPLAVGNNTLTVVVTAQDGVTTKTYTVTVNRAGNGLPAVATLSNLTISSGTLTPVFASATINYTASVTSATTSITVTPTATDALATIKVNGTTVASGTASAAIALATGANTIHVVVTAQNGTTTDTYTLVVTRPSTNAYLSNLTISSGTLSPAFAMATGSYTVSVSNATTSVTVTPTLNNPNGSIKVNGTTVSSGTASGAIPLVVGTNTITIVVTAQDGITHKTYTITVTRPSNNAYLSNLTISSGTLSPAFAMATGGYTDAVTNGVTSVTVTPTLNNPNGTVTVNGTAVNSGTASGAIPLVVGANTITAVVTAQDGVTHKTYTITVTRAMSGMNSFYIPGGNNQSPMVTSLGERMEANNILSPNGDGINDIWVVKNIAFYPDNTVTVYDRAGKTVFTKKGYTNDWTGAYRGSVLSEGTYYYLVDLGNGQSVKGFITVVSH